MKAETIKERAARAAEQAVKKVTKGGPDKEYRANCNSAARQARCEVYLAVAAEILGMRGYVRQVYHREKDSGLAIWEVGRIKEVGCYEVLAEDKVPAVALEKAAKVLV